MRTRVLRLLLCWIGLSAGLLLPVAAQAGTVPDSLRSVTRALLRYRELDALRQQIRRNLRDAEIRTVRSITREGPRDEFETEADYERRVSENEKKRAEIAGRYLLIERDTLKPIEDELAALSALRFEPDEVRLALGSYDLDNRRYNRVVLQVRIALPDPRPPAKGKKARPAKMHEMEAVAVLQLIPDEARTFREREHALELEPLVAINRRGNLDFAREIVVREPESGLRGLIRDCHAAYYRSEATGIKLVYIPPGTFRMGSNSGDDDEKPIHEVVLPRGFFMGEHEVTQAQWRTVMGSNPSFFRGDDRPVDNVTYEMAQQFVKRLNELEKTSAYRLPTEAEWEYACRAGRSTDWTFGPQEAYLPSYAWFYENASRQTHPVGQKAPNAWGLYDIHGNVWEWVSDWYAPDYYRQADRVNPIGPVKGDYRVLRGGSWNGRPTYSRSANRFPNSPTVPDKEFGLRIIRMED